MEKRKYEDVCTTELLDFVSKEISWKNDKERDKQQDFKNELELREPFDSIKNKIERMSNKIKKLEEIATDLETHKHDELGEVVIPIKKNRVW